jgi:hypothetical protein
VTGSVSCPCCGRCCPGRKPPLPDRLNVNIAVDSGDISCLHLSRTSWHIDWDEARQMWWSYEPTGDCDSRFGSTGCIGIMIIVQCCITDDLQIALCSTFLQLEGGSTPDDAVECANEIQEVNDAIQLCPAQPVFLEGFISTHTTGVFGCCFQTPNLNFRYIITE